MVDRTRTVDSPEPGPEPGPNPGRNPERSHFPCGRAAAHLAASAAAVAAALPLGSVLLVGGGVCTELYGTTGGAAPFAQAGPLLSPSLSGGVGSEGLEGDWNGWDLAQVPGLLPGLAGTSFV